MSRSPVLRVGDAAGPPGSSRRGSAPRPSDEADDRHEQRGPDDRPKDGEARAADAHREELGQAEEASQPQAHEGADESKSNGNQAAAAGHAGDGLAEGAAHAGNQEEEDEVPEAEAAHHPRGAV